MTITITDAQGDMDDIRAAIVKKILDEHRENVPLLSPSQVCGLFDITAKSLGELPLPKVDVFGNGRTIRYRLRDVEALIAERTIKPLLRRRSHRP